MTDLEHARTNILSKNTFSVFHRKGKIVIVPDNRIKTQSSLAKPTVRNGLNNNTPGFHPGDDEYTNFFGASVKVD